MKNLLFLFINILALNFFTFSQSPTINWQRCYGGSDHDWGRKIIKGTNNDLIIVGETYSSDGDIINVESDSTDIYWFRLDTSNAIINSHGYGGTGHDIAADVIPAWNNGYLILGSSSSDDNFVLGNHGKYDIWLFKITIQGVMQWQKCFGGSNDDFASTIIKTSDSCYVIVGQTRSDDGDVSVNHGFPNTNDAWLIKIDISGNILWEKTFGGPNGDYGFDVIETSDNGYLISGATYSNGGQVSGNHGALDVWVVKTDSVGTLEWQHCYGGSFLDAANKVVEVNSYYYLFGYNSSNDGDVTNNHPDNGLPPQASADAWLICIDSSGILQWEKSYGGSHNELGWDMFYINNYLFFGSESTSNDGDVNNNHSISSDFWLIQTDLQGNILWQSCYGGSDYDYAQSLLVDSNHLYALGQSSSNNGDVNGNHGGIDFWLIDLNIDSLINNRKELLPENKINIFPNPFTTSIYIHSDFKGTRNAELYSLVGSLLSRFEIKNGISYIDLSYLSSGVYFLSVMNNNQTKVYKIIKNCRV